MKKAMFAVSFASLAALAACKTSQKGEISLKTDEQKFSYIIGQQIGSDLKSQGLEVDADVLASSLKDAIAGKPAKLEPKEIQEVMRRLQEKVQGKQAKAASEGAEKGKAFLEANKKKPGIKVTASGLQHEVIKEGTGASPKATDTVKVHYRGTLIDGKEFDSSYARNEPIEFPLNGVIKGWTEGLQLMKVGGKSKFYIPSELAYGPRPQAGIPANSVLIFEVELLDIKKKS